MTPAPDTPAIPAHSAGTVPAARPSPPRRSGIVRAVREAVGLLLLALLFGAIHHVTRPKYSPQELAKLRAPVEVRIDETPLPAPAVTQRADFGTVHFGKQVVRTFEYVNRSGRTQELDAAGSRGQTKVTLQGESTLAPNAKVLVVASVDGRRTSGAYEDEILLFEQGVESPIAQYALSGRFEQLIEVQPPTDGISFGTVRKGTRIARNVVLAELKPGAFQKHSWSCQPDWIVVTEQSPVTRIDGTRVIDLLLAVPPSAPQGEFRGELVLSLDPDRFDPVSVPFVGKVQGP